MLKALSILAAVLVMAVVQPVAAQVNISTQQAADPTPFLNTVQLNVSDTELLKSRLIQVAGWTAATIYVEHEHGTASAVTVICWAGQTGKTLARIGIMVETSTSGTRNVIPHVWRIPVSAAGWHRFLIHHLNDEYLKCQAGSEGSLTNDDKVKLVVRKGGLNG